MAETTKKDTMEQVAEENEEKIEAEIDDETEKTQSADAEGDADGESVERDADENSSADTVQKENAYVQSPVRQTMNTTQASGKKKGGSALLGFGMLILGVALGVGGTLLVQKKPWKTTGNSAPKRDYAVEKYVTLGDYDGITVSLAASEEDIQSQINDLIDENTTYEQKKGTVKESDKIYARFDGYVDGELLEDTSGEEYVDIGADEYLEGFETAFVGAKTGEEFSFKINVPEGTYGDDAIDGKEVTFKATAEYICGEKIVPKWNDDFVQSISEFNTTQEYEASIKEEIELDNKESKQDFAWSEVMDGAKVSEYPEDLMKEAREQVLQGYYDMADMYGMSHDEFFQMWGEEDEASFVKNELENLAQDEVKEILVTEAIAKAEGINYSDSDYNQIVSDEYEYNTDMYDSEEKYEKEKRSYLRGLALSTAVKEWITDRAKFEI